MKVKELVKAYASADRIINDVLIQESDGSLYKFKYRSNIVYGIENFDELQEREIKNYQIVWHRDSKEPYRDCLIIEVK